MDCRQRRAYRQGWRVVASDAGGFGEAYEVFRSQAFGAKACIDVTCANSVDIENALQGVGQRLATLAKSGTYNFVERRP